MYLFFSSFLYDCCKNKNKNKYEINKKIKNGLRPSISSLTAPRHATPNFPTSLPVVLPSTSRSLSPVLPSQSQFGNKQTNPTHSMSGELPSGVPSSPVTVYEGPLSKTLVRLKRVSLTGCLCSFSAPLLLVSDMQSSLPMSAKVVLVSSGKCPIDSSNFLRGYVCDLNSC